MAKVEYVSTFPERFSELVEGKTVIEAGEMLGISKTTVSAYKTGKRSPKVPVLNSIAHFFHVDPLWLMGMNVSKYKEETPDVSVEGISEDRALLIQTINQMTDDQARALRAIADQVLSLRDK